MKERQRWSAEEDALLRAYVKRYGPRDWSLVSQRMNVPLHRDAKSCVERWKNYLTPSIKKGSLTEEEQLLVIQLQAKHGNKWKKIAAEVPGRTAKRLGKWWEVFKEKQQRIKARASGGGDVDVEIEPRKYDHMLENFAEKLVRQHHDSAHYLMAAPTLPLWLSSTSTNHESAPSVTLTLSPSIPVVQSDQRSTSTMYGSTSLAECCRELEEGYQALAAHKKESVWRLRRVELQLESEKGGRRRERIEETEAKIRALREEQAVALARIDAEYDEQILCLRRDAEAKEQKLAEHWAAAHARLSKYLEHRP